MKRIRYAYLALIPAIAIGCGLFGGDGSGIVVDNVARFEKAGSALASSRDTTLDGDGSYRTTPSDLSGDLCYAILSLGDLGPGMFSMLWLAPDETFPEGPTSGVISNVRFSLAAPADIGGFVVIPADEAGMPDRSEIIRVELSFNYVDARFTLEDGGDEYVIRTVYATEFEASDATGVMERGDKLIKTPDSGEFRWADSDGLYVARPANPYRDATVVDAVYPGDGNPDYVPVTANFPVPLAVTYTTLGSAGKTWTLAFDLSDAVLWGDADPRTFAAPERLVEAFRLKFGPNQSTTAGETDDGIQASLSID